MLQLWKTVFQQNTEQQESFGTLQPHLWHTVMGVTPPPTAYFSGFKSSKLLAAADVRAVRVAAWRLHNSLLRTTEGKEEGGGKRQNLAVCCVNNEQEASGEQSKCAAVT